MEHAPQDAILYSEVYRDSKYEYRYVAGQRRAEITVADPGAGD